jgi:hypothetical protein
MSAWRTYSLEDFLMFSPRVYWRLFELANEALWPLPIVALLLGAALVMLALRPAPWSGRALGIALGLAWIWVAWTFLWSRYATVNWAIAYVAPVFALQGLLLMFWALTRRVPACAGTSGKAAGLALTVYALVLHPLVAVLAGRPIQAAEVFGIAPDPTAIATLGLLSMAQARIAWLLLVIPVLWLIASSLTLYAMGASQAVIPLAAAMLAIAARLGLDAGRR